MSEQDPAEQIAEALTRLRWRGGIGRRGGPEGHQHDMHRDAHRGHEGLHGLHGSRGLPGGRSGPHGRGPGGPALGRLLWALASTGEPLSVSDVAQIVGVDQPRASRLVAQGVDFGLLRREADAADARRSRVVLTEQGDAIVRRMREDRGAAVREALGGFSEAEREQLAALLGRLADAWHDGPAGMR